MPKDTEYQSAYGVKNLFLQKISNSPKLMNLQLPIDWQEMLTVTLNADAFKSLETAVIQAYNQQLCYPPSNLLFEAFRLCSFENTKVVLLGQDPYHGAGQAHGLSFSVPMGQKMPPSLKNIFKELKSDVPNFEIPFSGDLSSWATQGVLLLNAILSVEAGKPGSHRTLGWEWFTDQIITTLSQEKNNLVFMLWGNFAHSKIPLIDASKHMVLTAAHPSPLARGAFFGSKHFSACNAYLRKNNCKEIVW